MKSILIIADYRGWAFEKIYFGLKKHLIDWNIEILYQFSKNNKLTKGIKKFDLILYLCDFDLNFLLKNKLDRNKVILAIRSHVTNPIYKTQNIIKSLTNTIATSNQYLYEQFSKNYRNVYLLPGGVDVDIFSYSEKNPSNPLVLGWAGSRDNFGSEYRGLEVIEDACKHMGIKFNPALREVKYRNQNEMVSYYRNEIDVYIDLSIAAGRQNGILEAGASGRPVISTKVGIAESLLDNNKYGILVDRSKESICSAIEKIYEEYQKYSVDISNRVNDLYSWKSQAILFENCFNEVLKNV